MARADDDGRKKPRAALRQALPSPVTGRTVGRRSIGRRYRAFCPATPKISSVIPYARSMRPKGVIVIRILRQSNSHQRIPHTMTIQSVIDAIAPPARDNAETRNLPQMLCWSGDIKQCLKPSQTACYGEYSSGKRQTDSHSTARPSRNPAAKSIVVS